jgi:hypothetical protein
VIEKSLSCMLLLMVPEQGETGTVVHTAFMLFLFRGPLFSVFVFPSLEFAVAG